MKNNSRVSLFVAGGVSAFFTLFHCLMFYAFLSNRDLISPDAAVWATLQTLNSVCILMSWSRRRLANRFWSFSGFSISSESFPNLFSLALTA